VLNSRFNTHVPERLAARSADDPFCAMTTGWTRLMIATAIPVVAATWSTLLIGSPGFNF
jgi:hypothetical protein